ncbi:MAG: VCBS repeat-containing protein [Reichenbachiella sp.]|uniref:FG-GAP repeat domain-containing protein n=1 Tax=Reichenbachiella sp. TaxID=2184521 RepID=UPI0032646ED4
MKLKISAIVSKYSLFLVLLPTLFCTQACAQNDSTMPFIDVTTTHLNVAGLGNNTMDAAVADIDKDGDLDVILAMEYVENIILINDGKGSFANESTSRFPRIRRDSEDIAIADFDNDGDPDIIFVSEDDQVNEYYQNDGNGFFVDIGDKIPVQGTSNAVETADLNGDGFYDLVIGNAGANYLLINDGSGGFIDESEARLPSLSATAQDIELSDIDNDGDLDIIEANETTNAILINDGNGVFSYDSKRLPVINDQTREVDLGDIDNDGDLDIAFANVDFGGIGDPQNRLLLNDGQGFFTESPGLPKSALRTVDIDFADLNGDGFLDILSGNRFNGDEKLVLINNGNLNFEDQTTSYFPSTNMYVFDFQIADFNGDGIDDIYLCGFRGPDKLLFGTGEK